MAPAAASIPTWPDLSRPRRVHIVGIGGSGMSAIAAVLLAMGHRVSGSDAADSDRLQRLAAAGAQVHVGHDPGWLGDADVVTASTAIPSDDVEVVEAGSRGLRVWRRAETLAAICRARRTVAVSGTHGKTSTSAMLAVILRHAGRQPSYIVGGDVVGLGSGAAWDPDGEWLVVEADESDGTFLELGAEAVVVTSVEPDHLDFYGDEGALRQAFVRFVDGRAGAPGGVRRRPGGAVVAGRRARGSGRGRRGAGGRDCGAGATAGWAATYGTSPAASIRIVDVALGRTSSTFSVEAGGTRVATVELAVPGLHNVRNAVAALTMAQALGVAWTGRCHRPGALPRRRPAFRAPRRAPRRHLRRRLRPPPRGGGRHGWLRSPANGAGWSRSSSPTVTPGPRRCGRTSPTAFQGADVLLVTDIYPAGEPSRPGVTGRLIADCRRRRPPRRGRPLPAHPGRGRAGAASRSSDRVTCVSRSVRAT